MLIILLLIILMIFICTVFFMLTKNHNYWEIRNVRYLKPCILLGNYSKHILLKKSSAKVASEICKKFPNEPYVGTFYGTDPALLIQDPNLIKLILATDAMYFSGRENTDYANSETVTKNIFFNGGDEWKLLHQYLRPLFTAAKVKNMFPIINECAKELHNFLEDEVKLNNNIQTRSLLARFTMSCIISCTFGVNPNTLKRDVERVNPFLILGEKIFDASIITNVKLLCRSMWPSVFYGLGLKLFDESLPNFFSNLYSESIRSRQNNKSFRNDFIELFTELKRHNEYISTESYFSFENGEKKVITLPVNEELLVTSALIIFSAGFETTSTTSAFLLYELAKNEVIQARVIEEIDTYFRKRNGELDYECVNELPYLEACINEILRLYPPLNILTREVMHEYTLPTGLRLQKGDRIHIPVCYIHRHPDYFSDPDEFRPERFLGEELTKINPFTYLPFGQGARMCLGKRFAKMPLYTGLLTIFKNYRIELTENMPRCLKLRSISLTTQPEDPINLKFIPRI